MTDLLNMAQPCHENNRANREELRVHGSVLRQGKTGASAMKLMLSTPGPG